MVDWMVEVRPEAEDFDWRTGREAACSRLSCFHIIQFCWDLMADLIFLHKTKPVISSRGRGWWWWCSSLSQPGRAVRRRIKLSIIQITPKDFWSLHIQSPSSHHYPVNSVFGFILGRWKRFPGPGLTQQYDRSICSLRGHPDRLQLPCSPASHLAASRSGPLQLSQTAQPAVLRGADPGRVASGTRFT